ncbi:hypothetical protein JTE90_003561 [Oedothorax gibbosus]|uniref:Uncharacterized protein n=1 Tax=Oedothorax gibbosus TaxID=931172 RepID=A0AAV6VII1_9ARAC|nr:hypothetical protein JTE90_003561 [Oedothorax gibbosus]
MNIWSRRFACLLVTAVLLGTLCTSEQEGLLQSLPADILASLTEGDLLAATGGSKNGGSFLDSMSGMGKDTDIGAAMKMMQSVMTKQTQPSKPFVHDSMPSMKKGMHGGMMPIPVPLPKKMLKALPLKKKMALKATAGAIKTAAGAKLMAPKFAAGATLMAPKFKKVAALKAKPKVYSLKPIVHIVEKPVPVFHKVPYPKKVMVPKFYKVMKPIPFPKIVPVPFKVPVKKIIPKIVKIPKFIPVPKFYPVKKPIPIGIPYPVPKFYKVPIPKPVPYKKYIPIPIPKKVPKFIPVPIKKIIKVPKPFYVPIKVPHFTASYMKTPMVVKVPDIKKPPLGFPHGMKGFDHLDFIAGDDKPVFKLKDVDSDDKIHDKH